MDVKIELDPQEPDALVARRIATNQTYGIEQLSDGERSALLLASEVLTAPKGTLLLLDEPERHLHRSIISPLLSGLFAQRSDCNFVISTHDLLLPHDCGPTPVLVLRSCMFTGDTPLPGMLTCSPPRQVSTMSSRLPSGAAAARSSASKVPTPAATNRSTRHYS